MNKVELIRIIRETCPELVEGFVVTGRADRDVGLYIHSVRVIREIRGSNPNPVKG